MNSKLSLSVRRVRSTLRTGVDTGSSFIRTSGNNNNQGSVGSGAGHPSDYSRDDQQQAAHVAVAVSSPGSAY